MRRAGLLLMALFLVNLPFAHQTWTSHRVATAGEDVEATVVDTRRSGDTYLVEYRLPPSVDPDRTRFSARVDRPTFEQAEETDVLAVRVVPGKPGTNLPTGNVGNHAFLVVALLGDAILLLVAGLAYRRWRARSRYAVVDIDGDEVTLESPRGRVTVVGPDGWARRLRPGQRVSGALRLVVDHEVVPGSRVAGPSVTGLEQLRGSSYVVSGRVVDARAGRVVLELDDRSRLDVDTGSHRIRADIRDSTVVRGTLHLVPSRG